MKTYTNRIGTIYKLYTNLEDGNIEFVPDLKRAFIQDFLSSIFLIRNLMEEITEDLNLEPSFVIGLKVQTSTVQQDQVNSLI